MTAVRGLLLILDPKPHTRRKFFKFFVNYKKSVVKLSVDQREVEKSIHSATKVELSGLVPKGSSVGSFILYAFPNAESFERMVLQLEEANTMNNRSKEQSTTSAQHEQRMHEYYTSPISTVFTESGLAMTPAPPPRSIPEPPSFSTHVYHRDPLNAPSTSQSNAHDDDDDASLEESQED
ncbi:hypothetical protein Dimus_016582 [Dionaea muscipula]